MAQIKADEITQLLREQIANYDSKVQVDEVGTITSLGDGIARLHGLDKVMAGELLSFPHGIAGLALSLAPFLLAGFAVSNRLRHRLPPHAVRAILLAVCALSAIGVLVKAFWGA